MSQTFYYRLHEKNNMEREDKIKIGSVTLTRRQKGVSLLW